MQEKTRWKQKTIRANLKTATATTSSSSSTSDDDEEKTRALIENRANWIFFSFFRFFAFATVSLKSITIHYIVARSHRTIRFCTRKRRSSLSLMFQVHSHAFTRISHTTFSEREERKKQTRSEQKQFITSNSSAHRRLDTLLQARFDARRWK